MTKIILNTSKHYKGIMFFLILYTVLTLGAQLAWFLNVNVTMYIWKDLSQPSLYGSNSLDFINLIILTMQLKTLLPHKMHT